MTAHIVAARTSAAMREALCRLATIALFATATIASAQDAGKATPGPDASADAASRAAPLAAPGSAPAGAEGAKAATAPARGVGPARARPGEPLIVFNRRITTFRQPFLGVAPAERAVLARERIDAVLARGGPGKAAVVTIPQGRMITLDGEYVFVLTPEDATEGAGVSLDTTAQEAVGALARVVEETREARDGRRMLRSGVIVAVATVVFVALLWILIRVGRVIRRRSADLAQATTEKLTVGGGTLMPGQRAAHAINASLRAIGWLLMLLVTYEWLGFVLSQFPFTRPWGEQLNQFLLDTLAGMLVAVAQSLPDLAVAVFIFFIAYWVDQGVRNFFDGVRTGRINVGWVDRDTAPPTRRLATMAVWIFALVMAYPYIPGSDTDAFKGLSVLVGLMVTVGASSIVGQAASGFILMYARTYRPGDFVRIGDSEGTILVMGTFTTRIRTGMGVELTIPNGTVLNSVTHNYSRAVKGAGFVVDATVTIGYDTPWRQVEAMLVEAAHRCTGILADPPPRVFQVALSDFYVEYRLVCQALPEEPRPRAVLMSDLHAAIQDVFNEYDVQIMSPHYLGDPREAKVVPPEKWYPAPARPPASREPPAG